MGKHGDGTLYRKRGRGCWRVKWMFQGKLHDESTGTEDIEKARKIAKQKTACSSALGDVLAMTARLEKAKDEQAIIEAKMNPSLNLFRMIDAFISCDIVRRKRNSESTISGWRSMGNLLINRFGGTTELRQLKREDVEAFMRDYEQKVSTFGFNHALQFYKRVWRVLKQYDSPTELKARLGSESPWEYITPIKNGEVHGKRPFTPEQLKRIWRVLEEMNNPELTMLFDLARNTGARLHDLVSWKWEENVTFVKEDGKFEAVINFKPIKTMNSSGKSISIPILDERVIRSLYDKYRKREVGQELVIPKMLELYEKPLSRLCQSVFKKAGIETTLKVDGNAQKNCVYGMHSFRHTLVSELFNKGVDLGTIQHLYAGHGSQFITELYAHAEMDRKRKDLANLSRIDIEKKEPTGYETFIGMMNDNDKEEYDHIKSMDIPKNVSHELVVLLKFKSKKELTIIKDWIERRLSTIASDGV